LLPVLATPQLLNSPSASCTHHLLKTFYVGADGWSDRQLGDGTVIWTAPIGHTYTTKPGGSLYFPVLSTPTGDPLTVKSRRSRLRCAA
jgi:hypothetical protein